MNEAKKKASRVAFAEAMLEKIRHSPNWVKVNPHWTIENTVEHFCANDWTLF